MHYKRNLLAIAFLLTVVISAVHINFEIVHAQNVSVGDYLLVKQRDALKAGDQAILASPKDLPVSIFPSPDSSAKPMFSVLSGTLVALTHGPDIDKKVKSLTWWRVRGIGIEGWVLYQNAGSRTANVMAYQEATLDKRVSDLDAAITAKPKEATQYLLRGIAKFSLGKRDDALADFNNASLLDASNAYTRLYVGLLNLDQKNYDAAVAAFSEAIKLSPNDALMYYSRGRAYQNTPYPRDCYTGDALPSQEVIRAAYTDYSKAIQLQPNMVVALNNLGILYGTLGNRQTETAQYQKAVEIDSYYSYGHSNLAIKYRGTGQLEQAFAEASKAIAVDVTSSRGYIERAQIYLLRTQFAQGIQDLEAALKIEPGSAYAYDVLSHIYELQQDWPNATKATEGRVRNDPSACSYLNLGYFQAKNGQLQEAVASATHAIELKPDFIAAYMNRASAYDKLKEYKKSMDDYTTLIRLNPGASAVYYRLRGQASSHSGDAALGASIDYYYAFQLDPTNFDLALQLAEAYFTLSEYDKAITYYTKATELRPEDAEAYADIGDTYYQTKQYVLALEYYEKYLQRAKVVDLNIQNRIDQVRKLVRAGTLTPNSPQVAP